MEAVSQNCNERDLPKKKTTMKTANNESQLVKEIHDLQLHIHPPVPNPAPLGLIGFGLTTALLQVKHTRLGGEDKDDLEGVDTVVLGFAMFFGGLLQIIAGLGEVKRNNVFGYTAFCLYGGFWMSVATIEIVSLLATDRPVLSNEKASQGMLFMVSIFTFMLWTLTFKMNWTINLLFFLLGTTCMLLSFGVRNEDVDRVGGWFGVATSVNAFWLAYAELVNDVWGGGKEIIPLGHWRRSPFRNIGGIHLPGRTHGPRPGFADAVSVAGTKTPAEALEDVEAPAETAPTKTFPYA